MPKLQGDGQPALNAFATGLNQKQYSITVTTGLLNALDDAEIEAVLGHELTHIRNGDVRMLVIAVIIAGVISFFAEMFFRMFFQFARLGQVALVRRAATAARAAAGFAILIAVALIALAWFLSMVIRFALSRSREFLADAGSVELTKNPDAMISALRKIENRGELRRRDVGGDGNVRRQSARGLCRPVRDASLDRPARRRAGEIRRRARSRARSQCRSSMASPNRRLRPRSKPPFPTGRSARRAAAESRSCRRARRSSSAHRRRNRPLPSPAHGDPLVAHADRKMIRRTALAGANSGREPRRRLRLLRRSGRLFGRDAGQVRLHELPGDRRPRATG